jgi:soluble cytochrome b562
MSRPFLVLLLICVAAFAVSGCSRPKTEIQTLPAGPLSQSAYEHAFNVSAAGLAPKYGVGKPLDVDASAADQAAHVTGLQRLLRDWAGRIEGLQPPAAAARAQARYVAGIRSFATDLDRAKAALDRGDTKTANALLSSGRIVSAQTRADLVAARRAFHALGYDLEDLDKSPVATD